VQLQQVCLHRLCQWSGGRFGLQLARLVPGTSGELAVVDRQSAPGWSCNVLSLCLLQQPLTCGHADRMHLPGARLASRQRPRTQGDQVFDKASLAAYGAHEYGTQRMIRGAARQSLPLNVQLQNDCEASAASGCAVPTTLCMAC
jgi:hypothetical protein